MKKTKHFAVPEINQFDVGNAHLVDGPCQPYTWRHRGKRIGDLMQPAAWKMVNDLWSRRNKAAEFADLKRPVYEDPEHTADANAFGSLRRAANKYFAAHDIRWRVCIKQKLVYLRCSK
jgi:hypothetical protein